MTTTSKSQARLRAVTGGDDYRHGIRTTGRFQAVSAWGFCGCGRQGTRWQWRAPGEEAGPVISVELTVHEATTGHRTADGGVPAPDDYHAACGAFHRFDDDCLIPPTSPAGRVHRAAVATSTDAALALDRLRAIQELRAWLDDEEAQAVIGCRLARATWAEMGDAIGSTRQAAFNRWSATIKRYESVGLIDNTPEPGDGTLAACEHGHAICSICHAPSG